MQINDHIIVEIPNVSQYVDDNMRKRWHHWIDALEGRLEHKYKQGSKRLRNNDCYCVVGTALDLFKEELHGDWHIATDGTWEYRTGDGLWISMAPLTFCELLLHYHPFVHKDPIGGLFKVKVLNPKYNWTAARHQSLSALNDKGFSFADLAGIMKLAITTGYRNPDYCK